MGATNKPNEHWRNAHSLWEADDQQVIKDDDHKEGYCYDHITPCDEDVHSFPKEQTKSGTSAPRENTQDGPIIKQALSKCQSDSLLRQWNNESSRQAQTPREWEVWRPREGRVDCGDMYTNHNDASKGCGVATTGDNNATNRQAVTSTVYNGATDMVEVASTVDNRSGVVHEEHGNFRE
jgi:hypothetical protein